jgi:hypothetical protein
MKLCHHILGSLFILDWNQNFICFLCIISIRLFCILHGDIITSFIYRDQVRIHNDRLKFLLFAQLILLSSQYLEHSQIILHYSMSEYFQLLTELLNQNEYTLFELTHLQKRLRDNNCAIS